MNDWGKFNETTLPEYIYMYIYIYIYIYTNLNTKDITDVDYMHANRVCKDFEIK